MAVTRKAGGIIARLRPKLVRHAQVHIGDGVRFYARPLLDPCAGSAIEIDAGATLISTSRDTALGVSHPVVLRTLKPSAVIRVGRDTGISGGSICAAVSVTIGQRVLIGADCTITDTDFHAIDDVPRRFLPIPEGLASDRVVIEDDVFLGTRTIVLKGVTIGQGSVVGAGSVVTSSLPPGWVCAGVPCVPVRPIVWQGSGDEQG